jgi:plasmid stability protein
MFLFRYAYLTRMSDITEKLGVGLTEEEKKQFRVEAAKRDMSMSELARQILLKELEELDGEGNPNPPLTKAAD